MPMGGTSSGGSRGWGRLRRICLIRLVRRLVDRWYRSNRYYSSDTPFFLRRNQVSSGTKRFVFIRIVCMRRIWLVRVRLVRRLLRRRYCRGARTSEDVSWRGAVLIRTRAGSAIHNVVRSHGRCGGLWLIVRWLNHPSGRRRLRVVPARGRNGLGVGGVAGIDRVGYGIL